MVEVGDPLAAVADANFQGGFRLGVVADGDEAVAHGEAGILQVRVGPEVDRAVRGEGIAVGDVAQGQDTGASRRHLGKGPGGQFHGPEAVVGYPVAQGEKPVGQGLHGDGLGNASLRTGGGGEQHTVLLLLHLHRGVVRLIGTGQLLGRVP